MTKKTEGKGLVKKMREIRDTFSKEIMDMTLEEEKSYIKRVIAELKLKHLAQSTGHAE